MRGASLKLVLVGFAVLGLVQCGILDNGGINSKISFKVAPKAPVVINSEFTIITDYGDDGLPGGGDDTTETIKAPWFLAAFEFVNKSDSYITVQNISYEAMGFDSSGKIQEFSGALDPEEIEQTYLLELAPAGQAGDSGSTGYWYFHGLPEDVVGYSYSVTATIEGWKGRTNAPEKRIDKQTSFVTR